MLPALTQTDISIDILIGFFWVLVMYRAFKTLFFEHACARMKAILVMILAAGLIYEIQMFYTVFTSLRADARLWDIYNGIVMMGSFIISSMWYVGRSLEWEKNI